jgi:ribosomal protein S18 acetylase RimI-like enzyme
MAEAWATRRAGASDADSLAALLSRAFATDPLGRYLLPPSRARRRQMERGFRVYLRRIYLPEGQSWMAGSASGAAIWLPPGGGQLGRLGELRVLLGLWLAFGLDATRRTLRTVDLLEQMRPSGPHWYLAFLGVDPALQGRGIGRALLERSLQEIDRSGQPACLETANPRNLELYRRMGFAVVREFAPPGGPPMWGMMRGA